MPGDSIAVGLWGKLPARGDFVRVGLGREFTDAWDGWISAMLLESQTALGADWQEAWMVAPVWRFSLAAGMCGGQAALGLWMPSVDCAGRCYPLTLAALMAQAMHSDPTAQAWLDAAEYAGRAALAGLWEPQRVAAQLPAMPPEWMGATFGDGSLWWGEQVTPFALPGLPDGVRFTAMLAGDAAGAA